MSAAEMAEPADRTDAAFAMMARNLCLVTFDGTFGVRAFAGATASNLAGGSSRLLVSLPVQINELTKEGARFGVSLLSPCHEALADQFARPAPAVAGDALRWTIAPEAGDRTLMVSDSAAAFLCTVEHSERHGAALVLVVAVEVLQLRTDANLLLARQGRYEPLGWSETEARCAVGL